MLDVNVSVAVRPVEVPKRPETYRFIANGAIPLFLASRFQPSEL